MNKVSSLFKSEVMIFIGPIIFACLAGLCIVRGRYLLPFLVLFPLGIFIFVSMLRNMGYVQQSIEKAYMKDTPALPRQSIKFFVLMIAALILFLNYICFRTPTLIERLLASLSLVLCFLPTLFYVLDREKGVPFLPMFGILFALIYAVPTFIITPEAAKLLTNPISQEGLEKALILCVSGFSLLLLSYYKFPGRRIGKFCPRVSIYWDSQKATSRAVLFGVVGLVGTYINRVILMPLPIQQISNLVENLSIISIGILFILQMNEKLRLPGIIFLWGILIPAKIAMGIATGLTFSILEPLFFLIMTFWCFRRAIPWKTGIVALLLLVPVLAGTKNEFREITWGGKEGYWYGYKDMGVLERVLIYPPVIWRYISGQASYRDSFDTFAMRLSRIRELARVVDYSPESVPYLNGATYRVFLLWRAIPRLFYWDKPVGSDLELYGHRYDIQYHEDFTSVTRLPQLIEMYVNFGPIGILAGMFLVGIIYRILYEIFCHPRAGEGSLLIGLFVFMKLSDLDGDMGQLGMVPYYIIFLIFVNSFIRVKRDLPEKAGRDSSPNGNTR